MGDRKMDSEDDLLWGGIWLYFATGDILYLDRVTTSVLADPVPSSYMFSLEKKLMGTQLLLTRLRFFIGPGYPGYLEAACIPEWYWGDTFYKTKHLHDFSKSYMYSGGQDDDGDSGGQDGNDDDNSDLW
ncbi:hypothetical protein AALP_AA6G270600 [Arabis alpina]|uniref:cellulase n=1 Tax=Arabis alpina TaxID=50452 RepID=A0A087GRZ8_ARAAL|nr:hypothetical protein AALP_AA6G270600 [Arabis alpina]